MLKIRGVRTLEISITNQIFSLFEAYSILEMHIWKFPNIQAWPNIGRNGKYSHKLRTFEQVTNYMLPPILLTIRSFPEKFASRAHHLSAPFQSICPAPVRQEQFRFFLTKVRSVVLSQKDMMYFRIEKKA